MQITKKYIRKTYAQEAESINIYLEDTRDNYMVENALGTIGSILVEKENTVISPDLSDATQIARKEKILLQALTELLDTTEIDFFSPANYDIISRKIADGTLKELGYTQEEKIMKELEDYDVLEHLNKHQRH